MTCDCCGAIVAGNICAVCGCVLWDDDDLEDDDDDD
jgi:hypothetical protein